MLVDDLNYDSGTRVLVWRLEEATRLISLCRKAGLPYKDLEQLSVKRQREKAAERLLLCKAFGRPVELAHTSCGVPYVEDLDVNISFTHTTRVVALAFSENSVIGIDAEHADREQVLRVRDKYLNEKEKLIISPDDLVAHIIAWTAKEAVYKAERNKALDWTDGICLNLCPDEIPESGEMTFTARGGINDYCLTTRLVEDHYLTLADPCAR